MHTKGQWYTSESVNIHEQRIIADEETGQTIAVVYGRGGHDTREDETRANANLIAAAPELLEALEMMIRAANVKEIDPLVMFASIEKAKYVVDRAEDKQLQEGGD